MPLKPQQHDAMVWLGEPATRDRVIADELIEELESLGIVDFDRATHTIKFTPAGKRVYRDAVGHWPARNV